MPRQPSSLAVSSIRGVVIQHSLRGSYPVTTIKIVYKLWSCLADKLIFLFLSFFSALGAAYGTAKSGTGIAAMSVMRPDLIMKSVIPVVMAGIIAIYGLVVSVLIANRRK